jgi:predicted nucleic acid-binding protein
MTVDRIYIDSCCFIDAVKTDVGEVTDADRANDIWYIKACLKAAKSGDIEVLTSHLTIAECRRAGNGAPTENVKRLFNSILVSGKVVRLADLTLGIAERARDLEWLHGITLGGADAIHVATAITLGCKEFFTFDMSKNKSPIGRKKDIAKLGLRVITPSETFYLPESYKQLEIEYPETDEENALIKHLAKTDEE